MLTTTRAHRAAGLAGGLAFAFALLTPGMASAVLSREPAIEARILEIIDARRAERGLVGYQMHSGLRGVAREHSREMAAARRLSHDGFEARIDRAAPDPAESNGAPDDGFWENGMAGCEDAAYHFRTGSVQESDEEVAQKFYQLWYDSPPHRDCLFDVWGYGLSAAGVGLVRDSRGTWWATLEVARDATPPGGGRVQSAPPPPTPQPAPAVTAPPPPPPAPHRVAEEPKTVPAAAPPPPVPAAPPPPSAPETPCRFEFWLLRVNRCPESP